MASRTSPRSKKTVSTRWFASIGFLVFLSLFGSSSYSRLLPSMRALLIDETTTQLTFPQRVIWLMSFPNSGTSFTITNTQRTSLKAVATNYEQEVLTALAPRLLPTVANSPFILSNSSFAVPDLVLTKTHCDGFCEKCVPSLTVEDFLDGCRAITFQHAGEKQRAYYTTRIVRKAVHLFRSPFDNLVARMHLGLRRRGLPPYSWPNAELAQFSNTPDGMRNWCVHADSIFQGDMDELMTERGIDRELWVDLPCHTDWFRYVQWHNHAIELLDELGIDVHVLYYEDYSSRYNETVADLFDFLELDQANPNNAFIAGKTYESLYDERATKMAKAFVQALASKRCWELIEHYFVDRIEAKEASDVQHSVEMIQSKSPAPKVAWLLSYPNSGTSYTMMNTLAMTNMSTATNHGQEVTERVPLRADIAKTPFLMRPKLPIPEHVLTKTHCTGFCFKCTPESSSTNFEKACLTGSWSDHGLRKEAYPLSLVDRSIHLVRNPFDNIVSRMHHALSHPDNLGIGESDIEAMRDPETGLRAWCAYVDKTFERVVPPTLKQREDGDFLFTVPCHADFIRYVMWHNMALEMTERLDMPSLTLYYENYTSDFDGTVAEIAGFLEQALVAKPSPFMLGKNYLDLFDEEHIRDIERLVRSLASVGCWRLLKHYFDKPSPPVEFASAIEAVVDSSSATRNGTEIVWLMSFPNSGTSYTMMNLQRLSNTSGASNYRDEVIGERIVPVRSDLPHGPFLLHPERQVPTRVATKTHCTGYCDICRSSTFVHTIDSFELGCREIHGNEKSNHSHYPATIPSAAIHIVRNVFDQLVSRKHQAVKNRIKRHPELFNVTHLPEDSKEGLAFWCRYVDGDFAADETASDELKSLLAGVPCGPEVYRFVQWHNLALDVTNRLELPVLYVHYEDYRDQYNATVDSLKDFLGLKAVQPGLKFEDGKSYEHLFDDSQLSAIATLIRKVASPAAYELLRRYVDKYLNTTEGSRSSPITVSVTDPKVQRALEMELPPLEGPPPKVAWLLSFPNSGTSYTHTNVRELSQQIIATNYQADKWYEPLDMDYPEGPFVDLKDYDVDRPLYALTKTHCAGYSVTGGQKESHRTVSQFQNGCASGYEVVNGTKYRTQYDAKRVAKAVHLVRNPFNNLVARMHLLKKTTPQLDGAEGTLLASFSDTIDGRLTWCSFIDSLFVEDTPMPIMSDRQMLLASQVPCFSEWYRYTMWHNLALEMEAQLELDVHFLRYEDYSTRYNETVQELFDYLELPRTGNVKTFIAGKSYLDLYPVREAQAAARFVRSLASPKCWSMLHHYFDKEHRQDPPLDFFGLAKYKFWTQ